MTRESKTRMESRVGLSFIKAFPKSKVGTQREEAEVGLFLLNAPHNSVCSHRVANTTRASAGQTRQAKLRPGQAIPRALMCPCQLKMPWNPRLFGCLYH